MEDLLKIDQILTRKGSKEYHFTTELMEQLFGNSKDYYAAKAKVAKVLTLNNTFEALAFFRHLEGCLTANTVARFKACLTQNLGVDCRKVLNKYLYQWYEGTLIPEDTPGINLDILVLAYRKLPYVKTISYAKSGKKGHLNPRNLEWQAKAQLEEAQKDATIIDAMESIIQSDRESSVTAVVAPQPQPRP